jgi:predicted deacylase
MKNKQIIAGVLIAILIVLGISIFVTTKEKPTSTIPTNVPTITPPVEEATLPSPTIKTIGTSVEGRIIETYTYGEGEKTLLFVGGIHGGYEWNSTLLAYEFIDQIENKSIQIPTGLKVVIIPTLNPDGLYSIIKKVGRFRLDEIPKNDAHTTGQGRFNANEVDLNRNFACKWKPESTWRGKTVSAGTAAFSEPEAAALRDLVLSLNPQVVVFWHSQANTVYASECEDGVLPLTLTIMNTYAKAAGYNAVSTFDAYPITGDAEGWLASLNIPAITVELKTRLSPEWEQNRAGIESLLNLFKERE